MNDEQPDRIDHVSEALNFLDATTIDTHGDDDRKVAIAQVHATLALAQQQRITNIIAISGSIRPTSQAHADSLVDEIVQVLGI